jgi:hypothetical protein
MPAAIIMATRGTIITASRRAEHHRKLSGSAAERVPKARIDPWIDKNRRSDHQLRVGRAPVHRAGFAFVGLAGGLGSGVSVTRLSQFFSAAVFRSRANSARTVLRSVE